MKNDTLTRTILFFMLWLVFVVAPSFAAEHIYLIFFLFIGVMIFFLTKKSKGKTTTSTVPIVNNNVPLNKATSVVTTSTNITCPNCGTVVNSSNKICPKCHKDLPTVVTPAKMVKKYVCKKCSNESTQAFKLCPICGGNEILAFDVPEDSIKSAIFDANSGTPIKPSEYAKYLFNSSDDRALDELIKMELAKIPDHMSKTLPSIEKRKLTMTILYCVLFLILSTLYVAYHTNFTLMIVVLVILTFIFVKITGKYGFQKYLIKEATSRPDEKISYIVASTMSGATDNKIANLFARVALLLITIGITFAAFSKPHLIYERVEGGYNVRYYTIGLLEKETNIVIPKTYRGENVIGIRGDTFENMVDIETIVLPDSIKEIRGGAFRNCINLRSIDLPAELGEIHGNAFENCTSLNSIVIPSTVTNIGGEAFINCTSLSNVVLSPNITEIHGGTFENCTSLSEINIPEGVTRVGGSAFRNCRSLHSAVIPQTVTEIGSSAFRGTSLQKVCVSRNASINERAFKETYAAVEYYEDGCKNELTSLGG